MRQLPFRTALVRIIKAAVLAGGLYTVPAAAAALEKAPSSDVTQECGGSPLRPGDECIEHIQTGSGLSARDRTFIVKVPESYDPGPDGTPLLVDLHGYRADGNRERRISGQWAQSNKRGFVAVWPDGVVDTKGQRTWNAYNCCAQAVVLNRPNDVDFLRQVIETVSEQVRIDDKRVYVTGHSAGGAMTHRMGCESADMVRAIAPTSFPIGVDSAAECVSKDYPNRSGPISETTFHGTDDGNVAYGPDAPSTAHDFGYARASFGIWADVNGCDTATGAKADPDSTVPGASKAQVYPDCKRGRFDNKPVVTRLVSVKGGKHQIYATPKDENHVDIAEYIWEHVFND